MGDDISYFLNVWPEIGLDFREDEHAIDSDFKGAVAREGNDLIDSLIEVPVESEGEIGHVVPLHIMFRRLVPSNGYVSKHGFYLRLQFVVEFVVLGLIVPGAPVVQVAVNAVFNLDMHQK